MKKQTSLVAGDEDEPSMELDEDYMPAGPGGISHSNYNNN